MALPADAEDMEAEEEDKDKEEDNEEKDKEKDKEKGREDGGRPGGRCNPVSSQLGFVRPQTALADPSSAVHPFPTSPIPHSFPTPTLPFPNSFVKVFYFYRMEMELMGSETPPATMVADGAWLRDASSCATTSVCVLNCAWTERLMRSISRKVSSLPCLTSKSFHVCQ